MRSDVIMKSLLENDRDILTDLLPQDGRESVPDVCGRDGHDASHLSTSERRSWIASTVSLVRVGLFRQGVASDVAGTGIRSVMNSR